ncbi:MAG: response regulator [Oscillospiraceae bacterium]|nr:response regulator [Oscillospiraceae bacterium]
MNSPEKDGILIVDDKEINSDAGMSHFHGMQHLYGEMLILFKNKLKKDCETMHRLVNECDWKNFSISAHRMKSLLAVVGAIRLSELASNLEAASKNSEADYCMNNYPDFHKDLLALHGRLSALLPENRAQKPKETGSVEILRENVQKAMAAIRNYDVDAAKDAVDTALRFDFGERNNSALNAALNALLELNFDTAAESLNKIEKSKTAKGKRREKTIFVVDDSDTNLSMAKEVLKEHYKVRTLPSAGKMFSLIEKIKPDLILLDIEMPEMDGFEALSRLKAVDAYADIPVIFLTSMTDASVEARGFQLGVVDFITKPFSAPVLLNRIKSHLDIDEIIRERTAQLINMQNGIVFVLADMVETRDLGTGGHIERTTSYLEILTQKMIEDGVYADELSLMNFELLVSSARLHDVGKIAISDVILKKPGKLTDEEFAVMQSHTTHGERIIGQIISRTVNAVFLQYAKLFTGYHHERWDGKGYPYGLSETKIPLQGRIMAIPDVYDALISERPYKKAFTHEKAVDIIIQGAGTQFDPSIVKAFYEIRHKFKDVGARL